MKINDYELEIDEIETKKIYSLKKLISEDCTCDTCKYLNSVIIANYEIFHEELKIYNIELNKSEDIYELERIGKRTIYSGIYHIVGKIVNRKDCWVNLNKNTWTLDESALIPFKYGKFGFTNRISLKKDYEPNELFQMELFLELKNV